MRVTVEAKRLQNETYKVEGVMILLDGPLSVFMGVRTANGHTLIPWDAIINIEADLDARFIADMDMVTRSKEMMMTNFNREYKRMTDDGVGGHFG